MPISEVCNIDRMDFLKKFPDNFFDLFIDDPPYGIGADNPSIKPNTVKQSNGNILYVKQSVYPKSDWDSRVPPPEYFDEVKRVSRNQIIWGVNYFNYDFTGGRIVWDKLNGDTDQYDCEIAYCSMNDRTDLIYCMWRGMIQGTYCGKDLSKAIIQQGNKKLNEKRIHPCQKPVILYGWLLNQYANPGYKIGDAHMGSQSSRIAAYKLGFYYWGCEKDKFHFKEGNSRFRYECHGEIKTNKGILVQTNLFDL